MSDPIYDATTFWELLERRVAATPDAPMLVDLDDRTLTFAEFRDRAEVVAAGLADMGIGEGTPVTWQLPTRIETIVVSLALSRLGAVQNPIIHIYRDREVGFCLRQTGAEFYLHPGVWSDIDFGAMFERVTADMDRRPTELVVYDSLPEGDPAALPALPESSGEPPVRWLYYTSGTTSDPKGAKHTDATLMAGGIGLARALEMSGDDIGSIGFPYAHIGGPDYMVTMLASGFRSVLVESFVLDKVIDAFAANGVTMAGGSTAFYTMFLNAQRAKGEAIIPSLRMLSGGGAPKPPEVYYEVKEEMGIPVCHGYGMTECPMIAQGGPSDTDEQLANTEGAPVHGCEVSIVDDDGNERPAGEEGEVRVAGPMVFKGYLDPALDAAAFDDQGRFRTGDLGVRSPDGHITLTGRLKDVIIRKGENVSAKEVEDVLYTHPKVGAVGVVGLPDRDRGERVCAVVETAPGAEPLTFDEMVEHCEHAGLMRQKTPEQLEVRDELPRNATLKILKYQLRDELKDVPWP